MSEIHDILCAAVKLCPHSQVESTTARSFTPQSQNYVVSLLGNSRATIQREVSKQNSGMVEETEVSFSVNNPANTLPLRKYNYHWYVALIQTTDGNEILIGSKDYPAELSISGSDTSDTITLIVRKPII